MSRVDPSDEDVNRVIKVADEIKEYGGSENEIYKMVLKGGRDELAPANDPAKSGEQQIYKRYRCYRGGSYNNGEWKDSFQCGSALQKDNTARS